jgi:hypothetical protein
VPACGDAGGGLLLRECHDHGVGRGLSVSPETTLASVAVLAMDDAGDIAPAAAMATLIFATQPSGAC